MRALTKKKYIIRLSAEERQNLTDPFRKGKVAAYRRTHAQILLFMDEGGTGACSAEHSEVSLTGPSYGKSCFRPLMWMYPLTVYVVFLEVVIQVFSSARPCAVSFREQSETFVV